MCICYFSCFQNWPNFSEIFDPAYYPYNCTQKFLGLGRVLGVATQNPTFSGFDTQKNTQYPKILDIHTQYYTQYPKILGATVCVYGYYFK
jgi:hypothetical protein